MTFWEKFGESISTLGKRFLICMLISVVGYILVVFVPVIGIVGLPAFLGGFFSAVSILEKNKCTYEKTITVTGDNGEKIKCGLIKLKEYAYMPVVPFVCPFFYIPYRTRYFIVKNIGDTTAVEGAVISAGILNLPILDIERIYKKDTHKYYSGAAFDNDMIAAIKKDREKLNSFFERYISENIVSECFENESVKIYKISDDYYLMYNSFSDENKGFCMSLSGKDKEKITEKNRCFFDLLLISDYKVLKNKLTFFKEDEVKNLNDTEKKDENYSKISERLIKKQIVAKKDVEQELFTKRHGVLRKIAGGFMFYFSLGGIALTLFSVATLFIPGIPLGILITFFLIRWGIKMFTAPDKEKDMIYRGEYELRKKPCTNKEIFEDEDGILYKLSFEGEGIQVSEDIYIAVSIGEDFYFLYLKDGKKPKKWYRAKCTEFADDVIDKIVE